MNDKVKSLHESIDILATYAEADQLSTDEITLAFLLRLSVEDRLNSLYKAIERKVVS